MTTQRITADNPHLAINIITRALESCTLKPIKQQAATVLIALDKAGLKVTDK